MHINALPESVRIYMGCDQEKLVKSLKAVLEGSLFHGFACSEPIEGANRSGRIFFNRQEAGRVWLGTTLSPDDIVRNLQLLSRVEARYDPPQNPGHCKGWEVYKTHIENKPVAIVWAAWAEEPARQPVPLSASPDPDAL